MSAKSMEWNEEVTTVPRRLALHLPLTLAIPVLKAFGTESRTCNECLSATPHRHCRSISFFSTSTTNDKSTTHLVTSRRTKPCGIVERYRCFCHSWVWPVFIHWQLPILTIHRFIQDAIVDPWFSAAPHPSFHYRYHSLSFPQRQMIHWRHIQTTIAY